MTQDNLEKERVYLCYTSKLYLSLSQHWHLSRNSEARSYAETIEECCLLTSLLACLCIFLVQHRAILPVIPSPTKGWISHINNQDNASQSCAHGKSSVETPFFQVYLSLCQVGRAQQWHRCYLKLNSIWNISNELFTRSVWRKPQNCHNINKIEIEEAGRNYGWENGVTKRSLLHSHMKRTWDINN